MKNLLTFQTQEKHFNFLEIIDHIEELETVFKNLSTYYTLKY